MARSTRKPSADRYERVEIASRAQLRAWLRAHHASARGAWIVIRKRAAGGVVAWNDVVEEALCFGWIDSLPRKLDDERTMLLVTPRKPASSWSAKNKAHVDDLERRGLMQPAGRAVVAAAKLRGTWTALDEVSKLVVPDDLATALAERPPARRHWDAFPPSARRGILEWIRQAKRPETRAARVAQTTHLAVDNQRANQWRKTTSGRR